MKHYYNIDIDGYCTDECPYIETIKIGSCKYSDCINNISYNDDLCYVICKQINNTNRIKKIY
ncbi:hypothetical protein M0Q50_02500 [bacterium]|jgi:hypothetical protein|nr:hypothetical protein [bacterium]